MLYTYLLVRKCFREKIRIFCNLCDFRVVFSIFATSKG